ncbi:TldD/PmbA family protein [Streptomyces mobaraensis NBRC 13819 = DSM 40847]|uniref:metallopeptidase TldD-related protein n=1 Tax=Streptomyces mobaraensis TaxID=35621 RepID=UPI00034952E5|nr:metallopeptidase TldD-related protein [Streptomyces mobaraensis]QTT73192.1 TldD/PmbA family protein [Streptomyces mobaraensis NBRC 13819 = DSM 40847]
MTARRNRPQEIVERTLALSRADGCAVVVAERSSADLRWARNALTTNGTARGRAVTVIATVGGGQGTAAGVVSGSAVTADDVEPLVRAAEEAARGAGPADDAQPLVADVPHSPAYAEPPAGASAAVFDAFAPALGESFARARAEGRELYGYARHQTVTSYLGTSTGLRLRHDQPMGRVELNAKDVRGTGSAWLSRATDAFADVDPRELDAELARRLVWAARGRSELPAGRYPTLLPPAAVADLVCYQQLRADARDAAEGRTVFARPGGGAGPGGRTQEGGGTRQGGRTRVGEKLSGLPLTLRSDPYAPGLECAPFVLTDGSDTRLSVFDSGLPLAATDWIRDGVLERLTAGRHTAALTGLPVAPYTDNLILEAGGARSLDEMVAASGHEGPELLLTSLWYIREVDPATLLVTGLTRDGVLLVRDGEVVGEVNNFRFNESPVDLLSRAVEAGRTERTVPRDLAKICPRAAMPALRVPDFHMSSVSKGV